MTSANVTNYIIVKNGEVVGEHSQHHMCHTKWHRLYKYTPFKDHTITSHWLDEEENHHIGETENLADFIKKHPPTIHDMKRMMEYIEQQNLLLEEWVRKFGDSDKELRLRTLNSICHRPI